MSEPSFADLHNESFPESAADTPETAPASAPESSTNSTLSVNDDMGSVTTDSAPEAPADTAPEGATGEEWRFNSAEWDTLHPELATYRKQLQASYTQAQQKLSEERKPLEGLDPGTLEWARRFNEAVALGQHQVARTMLQQVDQQLQGQTQQAEPTAGAAGEPTPPEQSPHWEYMTDTEQYLARQAYQAELRAYRAEQRVSQHDLASVRSEVDRQFGALEREVGEIPWDQKQAVLQKMGQYKAPPADIGVFWRGLYGFDHARRRGMTEGERLALQKAQMGRAPSAHVPAAATSDGVEDAPDFRTALHRAHGNV